MRKMERVGVKSNLIHFILENAFHQQILKRARENYQIIQNGTFAADHIFKL